MARRLVLPLFAVLAAVVLPGCDGFCTTVARQWGSACGETLHLNTQPEIVLFESRNGWWPEVREPMTFRAGATDVDGDFLYYEWDFDADLEVDWADQGPSGSRVAVETSYPRPGHVRLLLKVSDFPTLIDQRANTIATRRFLVHTEAGYRTDRPPFASFTIDPDPVRQGEAVRFDGTSSSDPDGSPDTLTYLWGFERGVPTERPAVSWGRFDLLGRHRYQLTVVDEHGKRASATQSFTVVAPPGAPPPGPCPGASSPNPGQGPTAVLEVDPNPVGVNENVVLRGYHSTDPTGDIAKYEWDYDGDCNFDAETSEPASYWSYGSPGTYTPNLRVTDAAGNSHISSVTLDVIQSSGGAVAAASARKRTPGEAFSVRLTGDAAGGRLAARLNRRTRHTRATRALRRFLSARWRSRLRTSIHSRGQRATVRGIALAGAGRGGGHACVRLEIALRRGALPRGTFAVVGGTGAAARLRGSGSFRFQAERGKPAVALGRLRASYGRPRAVPRRCSRLRLRR